MEKVREDGKVAVLYSPRYGAGWSTWNPEKWRETLCMDARIVRPVIAGNIEDARKAAREICGDDVCLGGSDQLKVEWVDEGDQFEITEYDGYERVHAIGPSQYMIA